MKKYTMHSKLIDEIYPVKEYGKQRIPALVRYNNVREERATKRFLKKNRSTESIQRYTKKR